MAIGSNGKTYATKVWEAAQGTIPPQRTFEQIVELITVRLHAKQLKPGDRLPPERVLAGHLKVGRPAVREAYRALELVGIVVVRQGKHGGAFVRDSEQRSVTQTLEALIRVDGTDLAELAEARLALEGAMIELAARRRNPKDLARLRACTDDAVSLSRQGITATDENLRFHVLLGEMSGNSVLQLLLRSVLDLLRMAITSLTPEAETSLEVAEDHYKIIDALEARDCVRARKLIEQHIRICNRALGCLQTKGKAANGSKNLKNRRADHRRRAVRP
jgi:GntR family transcriptional regulator, transcriptional repressor for pyruvate dehydrogenase complex